ncbi:MAG: hypothetical protein CMF52_00510 [Legionellales bacterium]|nr:hypothetical protein [Legionellales bacterium]|tara:strand:- start:6355 stop:6642 length:288 start_codon:yes stop_codon:yes gene_type:complete
MIRNLFKRKSLQPKLGRWGVTYEKPVLDKRINWANHDHCGSEVCEKHFSDKKHKEVENWDEYLKEKKKKKKPKPSSSKKDDDDDDDFYYYVPYCL